MTSRSTELLRSCQLEELFVEVLGWDRKTQPLPVTIVEIGVASPRTITLRLTGIAQKRGAQVFLCPPDEYGRVPNQTTRRLIQDQVKRAAHHNVIVFPDAARRVQVWQWADQQARERATQVYEHRVDNEAQATRLLVRLTAIRFTLDEEARLSLMDVVRRLRYAFADDHTHIQRGKHGRAGLAVYDLTEMDQGLRFWWARVLREPYLSREEEYPVACAMRRGDSKALDLMVRAHLHLIARIAWRLVQGHQCHPTDYLDLVQTGNLEMIRLAPGFDPNGEVRFQTYLTPRILKTLRRIIAGEEGMVPLPRYLLEKMPKIGERRATVEDRLSHYLGRMPFDFEVAEQLAAEYQVSHEDVARVLFVRDGFLSWDILVEQWNEAEADHEKDAEDMREAPAVDVQINHDSQSLSDTAVNLMRREQIEVVLGNLTPRERDVIRVRFGLDDGNAHTLEEVGHRFAVTRERVRQIELRALKKLRRMGPVTVNEKCELVAPPPLKQPRISQVTVGEEDFTETENSADAEDAI